MSASAFEALKKAFTTAPVLTHWIPDTQITVETDTSDYTLTTVLSSQLLMENCTPLHSTPGLFQPWNSTMMSMTKSYSWFMKLSNNGDITLKALDFQSMWSLITGNLQYFSMTKISRINKHNGPNTFPVSTCNSFPSWKTWNQTRHTY